jgi:hypothetical protein
MTEREFLNAWQKDFPAGFSVSLSYRDVRYRLWKKDDGNWTAVVTVAGKFVEFFGTNRDAVDARVREEIESASDIPSRCGACGELGCGGRCVAGAWKRIGEKAMKSKVEFCGGPMDGQVEQVNDDLQTFRLTVHDPDQVMETTHYYRRGDLAERKFVYSGATRQRITSHWSWMNAIPNRTVRYPDGCKVACYNAGHDALPRTCPTCRHGDIDAIGEACSFKERKDDALRARNVSADPLRAVAVEVHAALGIGGCRVQQKGSQMNIKTHFDPKPIPFRDFDYTAVTDNYDGAADARSPIGHGRTEAEAVTDLQRQIDGEAGNPDLHADQRPYCEHCRELPPGTPTVMRGGIEWCLDCDAANGGPAQG